MNCSKTIARLSALVFIAGCYHTPTAAPRPLITLLAPHGMNDYSVEDEMRLGKDQLEEIRGYKGVEFVQNPTIDCYVGRLVRILQNNLSDDFPHIPVHVWIVRGDSVELPKSARAIAGGGILLHLEKLQSMASEDQLVVTLAHELAHIELRHVPQWHSQRRVLIDYVHANYIPVFKPNSPVLADIVNAVVQYLRILDVQFEDDADLFAVRVAMKSGYDPHDFMSYLAINHSYPAQLTLLNRHRSGDERARLIEREYQRILALHPHTRFVRKAVTDRRFEKIRDLAAHLLKADS